MRHLPVLFLTAFLVVCPWVSLSHADEQGVYISQDVQLRLGDAFLAEGEFYRAITEYKKFRILFPDSERGDVALFRTGIACYLGEEYEAAAKTFCSLADTYPRSGYLGHALYYEGLSRWKKNDHAGAAGLFTKLVQEGPESPFAARALVARSLLELDRGDTARAAGDLELFLATFPGHPEMPRVEEALALVREYENLPQKSELLAAVLSAILPGSGYVYAGRYGDGLSAFLLNALFIAGTVAAVNNELYATSALTGGVGLPFYIGNIYGSANAVKKHNSGIKRELRAKIAAALEIIVDDKRIPEQ
jgi:outer membrane protein assembly factor BamD (BamD/ComL family)/TM2 domain-containing membrane protein YozV